MHKLFVIGLDGATWDVIIPLVECGELPNMKKLIKKGVRGALRTTFPPLTGPAWTSLATGKNPGKTGIFDFFNRISRYSYELKPLSSSSIHNAGPFWDHLSDNGIRVGVLNYPFLYPPYPINGFMVSGLGSSPNDEITYPAELKKDILRTCGQYKILIPFYESQYTNNPSQFVKECLELLEVNEKSIKLLLNKNIDVFVAVISATDFAQHYMWEYIDKSHPLYNEKNANRFQPLFVGIWKKIDQILGHIVDALGDNGNLLLVSDHGFGPTKHTFYLNQWFEEKNYLPKSNRIRLAATRMLDTLGRLNPDIYRLIIEIYARINYNARINDTDKVYSPQSIVFTGKRSNGHGQIFINSLIIKDKKEYLQTREEIIQNLEDTFNNLNLKAVFYDKESIYSGPQIELSPDILFYIEDFSCDVRYGQNRGIYKKGPHIENHNGSHRKDGIILAYGVDVNQGLEIMGSEIYDIAPTILHMFNLSVPEEMDGRVLKDIFKKESEPAQRDVKYQKTTGKEQIKERIKKLKKSGSYRMGQ